MYFVKLIILFAFSTCYLSNTLTFVQLFIFILFYRCRKSKIFLKPYIAYQDIICYSFYRYILKEEEESINNPLNRIAKEKFSIPYLYPIQQFVIANTLDKINQIVLLPTGSGKSVCFQVPLFFLKGITVVVVPLLSLLKDQMRSLKERGIECACIKGGQSAEERKNIFNTLRKQKSKILFTTPESLTGERLKKAFASLPISHLVIDEAHCVSEWGETFRPSYLKLPDFIRDTEIDVISAFTATASEIVTEKIREIIFHDKTVSLVQEEADRPNIHYSVIPCLSKQRELCILVKSQKTPIIVFVRSRKRAEGTARLLLRRFPDKQVYFYHAGLNKEEREEVERWFFHSSKGILVSTSAYGMGVDKSNIRTVVHYDVPPSVEAYLQESGRAGRDRKPTQAFLLYSPEDLEYELKLRDETSRERYRCISGYAVNQAECRRKYLLRLLNQELSHCSGCDVCSGHKKSDMHGLKEIERFVRCYKKRFSKRQIIYALCGQPSYEAVQSRLTRYSGFGLLKEWDREEIEEAIDSLVELKRIRVLNKGFWRGKLTVGKLS